MHLAGDLIGQDLAIPALERVERRPHDFLGRTLRRVDIARKVGIDEASMQPDDLGGAQVRCAGRWSVPTRLISTRHKSPAPDRSSSLQQKAR